MVDSRNKTGNYKTLMKSIGTIIEDPEMLRLIPDYLKMCQDVVEKLPFAVKSVLDRYSYYRKRWIFGVCS